jgi:hypothetical protein
MQAVDKRSWDSSVKALTQFPTVLNNRQRTSRGPLVGEAITTRPSNGGLTLRPSEGCGQA